MNEIKIDEKFKDAIENIDKGVKLPSEKEVKERLHHLDDQERMEVLHFTPTGELVGELLRRDEEYERSLRAINDIMDNMKIWA